MRPTGADFSRNLDPAVGLAPTKNGFAIRRLDAFGIVRVKFGAAGWIRTTTLTREPRGLSPSRLPVPSQPQNWSATKDLHFHTTKGARS